MATTYSVAIDAERPRRTHGHLAEVADFEQCPDDDQIERHAARSGDVAKAKQTARFFGVELRSMATRLSRAERRYQDAADLFRHVVENFDADDAYAWEYLGYNLARADAEANASGRNEKEILEAYREAHRLTPRNPLYIGRLLGYRAEHGHPIESEFIRYMALFVRDFAPEWEPVSWFAKPVFAGLKRARRLDESARLAERWRGELERAVPRVLSHHSSD
jgi:tetratricopeptide (TPR) repeat protein